MRDILEQHPVEASAPCRIDSGGTWDIKAMALPMEGCSPVTINMALTLRTRVVLSPFDKGRVKVSSQGFSSGQHFAEGSLRFDPPLGLYFAAISYFGFHGLHAHITSDVPPKSALGGSSTALIALIKALSKLREMLDGQPLPPRDILHLGYHLEDGVSGGGCGIQDQAAAVYGGVNQWWWQYSDRRRPIRRIPLMDRQGQKALSRRILVAFSGKNHASAQINRGWIRDFLSAGTRAGWIAANERVKGLGTALKAGDWPGAVRLLKEEMAIRREITPDCLIPITAKLIDQAEEAGCAARFTGAGSGGSVWALGEVDRIQSLKSTWKRTLGLVRKAVVWDCDVDPRGAV
jgi:D-glycero-alpha-D-manno-heptose-7-phosphate kinase